MLRLVGYIAGVAVAALGLSWLADRPGTILINWQGREAELSVFHSVVGLLLLIGLAILIWSVLRQLWRAPAAVGHFVHRQRHRRGLEALSAGMIAVGAGDKALAVRSAVQARKALPNEPLTHLLRAQAAQLSGDRETSRRIYEAMLASPDTEQLGLRGLFLEAEREHEPEAARQFAERALALNPKLGWSADALFALQCKQADWAGALSTLDVSRRQGSIEKKEAERRRAVLLTAQASEAEERDPVKAIELAKEAHELAHDLVPAAAILGRLYAARGNTPKAARVLLKTWKRSPHPDLATAYAYARPGDSPRDRLVRVQELARLTPHSAEGGIAVAEAAIDARAWDEARAALKPLLDSRLTQRVSTLMARIEDGQHGDRGKVREWLARTVNAPRDPAWTADGYVSERWMPVSPVTGEFDAFQWKVPAEPIEKVEGEHLAGRVEKLVALGQRVAGPLPDTGKGEHPITIEVEKEPVSTATGSPVAPTKASPTPVAPIPAASPAPARSRVLDPKTGKFIEEAAKPATTAAQPAPPKPAEKTIAVADTTTGRSAATEDGPNRVTPAGKPDPAAAAASGGADKTGTSLKANPAASVKPPAASSQSVSSAKGRDGKSAQQTRKPPSTNIYVAPRPPDDPGPEAGDTEEVRPR